MLPALTTMNAKQPSNMSLSVIQQPDNVRNALQMQNAKPDIQINQCVKQRVPVLRVRQIPNVDHNIQRIQSAKLLDLVWLVPQITNAKQLSPNFLYVRPQNVLPASLTPSVSYSTLHSLFACLLAPV